MRARPSMYTFSGCPLASRTPGLTVEVGGREGSRWAWPQLKGRRGGCGPISSETSPTGTLRLQEACQAPRGHGWPDIPGLAFLCSHPIPSSLLSCAHCANHTT